MYMLLVVPLGPFVVEPLLMAELLDGRSGMPDGFYGADAVATGQKDNAGHGEHSYDHDFVFHFFAGFGLFELFPDWCA